VTPLHLAFYFHDLSGGGVERMRLSLAAALLRRGVRVTLILHRAAGDLGGLVPPGAAVVELGGRRTLADLPRLIGAVRRLRPDVLFSSLDHNNVVAMLAWAIARPRTSLVICQHNALSEEAGPRQALRYRLVPFLYRWLNRRADRVLAVSSGVAAELAAMAGIAPSRLVVVHNPVVDARFEARGPSPAPHPWLADPAWRTFVFAGRLVPQKDPETALRALACLAAGARTRLLVLGQGPLEPGLRRLAAALGVADRVAFAGFVPDPLPWIEHAAGLVLSSRHEGFGNVIVEALALGTPVIATDCPHGPGEILEGGIHGVLVAPGDAAAIAGAMAQDLRARFPAAACRERALAFTAESCAERHVRLAAALLQERGRRSLVFGLTLCRWDAAGLAARLLETRPGGTEPALVVTPNIDHVQHLRDPRFARAYRGAALAIPDGFPVALYASLRQRRRVPRVTGCALVHALMRDPRVRAQRIFVVAESMLSRDAIAAWAERSGLLNCAVAAAPPRLRDDPAAAEALARQIAAHGTTLILMTLGAPTSETFIAEQAERLPRAWALCVGQAVRVEAGLTPRGPALLGALGLEWLGRLVREPRRLALRYARSAAWFPVAVMRDLFVPGGAGP
jgi:exopolysaccharide biosynthesis WecB/TagA/CpsF family protein